jgi:hypothetical protein
MGVLVENILATQTPILTPSSLRKTAPHFGKKHQEREEYVVSSNFELWVQKMREKRSKDYDVVSSTLSKWPHKIARKSRSKIDKAKQPRFENWESRLRQRLSKSPTQLRLLEKNPR